ncbi:IclR family transcriptional regulator [Mesorhizobium sp. M1148]|uniref:IclR family transcriptional regulator n=1 Tax=unclassified Mesorhizobium TaxID=325217 RepID=UPI0003CF8D48|nr:MULTISPECIES: IclR family transcriptional regulator [unclassified Mesorhizobium]ESW66166.1 ArsR family transcriptional regulator [Mesorhizobium sp. LSJC277A00]ESW81756.1 ArsR family transcriptional regulator [Mesorhizobium sp. LSJC269B00]ESX15434.1 ArsR family transcriptional regulator [Mesorhizobium sp. LSJC255A00]ESX25512.1 ArsR family transcriptional regulator [Mesorhizobium sp. LSHC440B00]ESX33644.1 ArsR family transcriptional regulator [Mesorhizobium sp. LSHC432A00]
MQDSNGLTDRAELGPAESPTPDKTSGSREKGLNRVLEILDFLHVTQRAIGIGDLAKGVNAPRSTTYTLVRSLVDAGLLEMEGDGNRVYFGKKLYLYGMDYVRGNDLLRRGRQEVDNLSRETGETSELCMLQSGRYTIVHSSPGTRPFRISSATGLQIPLPWTASGRLLLAGLERAAIQDMVSEDDLLLPDGRRLQFDDFIADIATARTTGYCITSGLVDAYTKCLAAPVFAAAGKVEATMCLVVPIDTSAEKTDELLTLLRHRAARLSIAG